MRWWNQFGRSLVFAILVSALYPIYESVAELLMGQRLAFATYLLATAAIYLLGIARRPAEGLAAAIATFGCGSFLLLAGATGTQLGLLTAVLIGVFRSGLLHRGAGAHDFGRKFSREFVFIGVGLALAMYLVGGAFFPGALAFWGFYLVQSGFFLLGGEAALDRGQHTSNPGPDAFARAIKRAKEVLAEGEGSSARL